MLELLRLEPGELDLAEYRSWLDGVLHPEDECTVAVVGKYIKHQDAYKSIYEALHHAGIRNRAKVKFLLVEAEELETGSADELLKEADAVLVPGGFGERGVRGKVKAVEYARTRNVRSSASASACSAQSSNSRETCSAGRTRTAPNSTK